MTARATRRTSSGGGELIPAGACVRVRACGREDIFGRFSSARLRFSECARRRRGVLVRACARRGRSSTGLYAPRSRGLLGATKPRHASATQGSLPDPRATKETRVAHTPFFDLARGAAISFPAGSLSSIRRLRIGRRPPPHHRLRGPHLRTAELRRDTVGSLARGIRTRRKTRSTLVYWECGLWRRVSVRKRGHVLHACGMWRVAVSSTRRVGESTRRHEPHVQRAFVAHRGAGKNDLSFFFFPAAGRSSPPPTERPRARAPAGAQHLAAAQEMERCVVRRSVSKEEE